MKAAPGAPENVEIRSDEASKYVLIHGDVPFLVPVKASDDDGNFSVSWDENSGADYYQYRVCEDGVCGDWEQTGANSVGIQVNGAGDFTVEVSACDASGCSSVSSSEELYVNPQTVISEESPEAAPLRNTMTTADIPAALDSSDKVGAVAGQFRVNESGQATYNVPIFTPKGRGGIKPSVSLSYSSQGGHGTLGVGWSLATGSAITRCRQTSEIDGVDKGITLTLDDRFCLDGQRLILASGVYGEANSTYRTEIASQTKVVAKGTAGEGPSYFEVYRKDGSKSLYGYTSDSQLEANVVNSLSGSAVSSDVQDTVIRWSQSSYIDNPYLNTPNTIHYEYQKSENFGEQVLEKITYPPSVEIDFVYQRTFIQGGMSVGGYSRTSKKLTQIIVRDNNIDVRKYDLAYKTKQQSPMSEFEDGPFLDPGYTVTVDQYPLRLNRITESAKNSSGIWISKKPTDFEWIENTSGYYEGNFETELEAPTWVTEYDSKIFRGNFQAGDINGDGNQDLVYAEKRPSDGSIIYRILKSKGGNYDQIGGSFEPINSSQNIGVQGPERDDFTWSLFDYNGDGYTDLFTTDHNGSGSYDIKVLKGGLVGYFGYNSIVSGITTTSHKTSRPQDYNGDGLPDLLIKNGSGWQVLWMEKTGESTSPQEWGSPQPISFIGFPEKPESNFTGGYVYLEDFEMNKHRVADFNGDGSADLVVTRTITKQYTCGEGGELEPLSCSEEVSKADYIALSDGNGNFSKSTALPSGVAKDSDDNRIEQFSDVNGDSLADYLYKDKSDDYWYYRLNTGIKLLSPVKLIAVGTSAYPVLLDYNSDGRKDIVFTKSGDLHVVAGKELGFHYEAISTNIRIGTGNRVSSYADVNGDGILEHLRIDMSSSTHTIRVDRPKQPDETHRYVINKIKNGMSNVTDITYKPLTTDSDLYTKGSGAANLAWGAGANCSTNNRTNCSPVFDLNGPMYVVSEVESTSPTVTNPAGKSGVSYRYGEARMQAKGRGFLGFEWLETKDLQTGVITRTEYRQDYPFIGSPLRTTVKINNQVISDSYNQWAKKGIVLGSNKKIVFPYIFRSAETQWNLNTSGGTTLNSQTLTQSEYDDFANVTKQITIQSESTLYSPGDDFIPSLDSSTGLTKIVTNNSYNENILKWQLGRLTSASVRHDRNGDSITRDSAFQYYADTGFLKKEIIEPNSSDIREKLTTVYQYDNYGNITLKRTCSLNVSDCLNSTNVDDTDPYHINRWTESIYDSDGRYVTKSKNAYGQVTQQVFSRNALGQPIESRSLSGVTTLNGYGAFGHKYFSYNSAGNWSKETKFLCNSNCPSLAVYGVKSEVATGKKSYVYFDALGREIQKAAIGFDGRYSVTTTEFNLRGLAVKATEPKLRDYPYSSVSDAYFATTDYDVLGRPEVITNPDDGTTEIAYEGKQVITTNPLLQVKTEKKDSSGKTVEVIDNKLNSLHYDYNATGDLTTLTFVNQVQSEMQYDDLGRKISMKDADKGGADGKAWTYEYNALGELVTQTDAKSQTIITYRDRLGRIIKRLDKNSSGTITGNHQWFYNNNASPTNYGYDVGKVYKEIDYISGYEVLYGYDDIGRLDQTSTYIDNELYIASTVFDQFGRVFQSFDAASSEFANAGTRNVYNPYGYLESVHDARGEPQLSNRLHFIEAMDARGNVTVEIKGTDTRTATTYFADTGRLKTISTESNNKQIQLLEYYWDAIGNLKWRETKDTVTNDMIREDFLYDELNRLTSADHPNESMDITYFDNGNIRTKSGVGTYSYGGACNGVTAGPHAVTQTTSAEGDATTYCYDENGNMLSGDGRTMSYSTFDKLVRVDKGGHTTKFDYAPSRSRYKRVDIADGKTTTTYYVGNVEIIKHSDKSYTTYRRNLGGALVEEKTNGTKKIHYLHKDHLGSTDVITNTSGNVVQHFSFNAFGERRDPINWETYTSGSFLSLSPMSSALSMRGYTGHEQVDEVGLIHMNGRVYDSKLGRFIQADPHIQAPSDSQNLNRYSYVNNNPLSYTDPTGYFLKNLLNPMRNITRGIMRAVGYEASSWLVKVGSMFCGPWAAACAAAGTYDLNRAFGASTGDALKAGIVAGATTYAFQQAGGGYEGYSYGDIIKDGLITAASYKDPKLGQALNYVFNGFDPNSVGDSTRNLVSAYGKVKASEEFERFARKNGMTLQELNLYMLGASFLGNEMVGTRFYQDFNQDGNNQQGIMGILSRNIPQGALITDQTLNKSIGLVFDVIDIALGYQGIITASGYDFIRNGNSTNVLYGHSLGTLDVSTLVARGWASSGKIYSLPFGNIAPANISTTLGEFDIVNGAVFGTIFNPWSNVTDCGSAMGLCHTYSENYKGK
ncbi:toxin TcdB middle/N-terminal domain-containing protein [Kangiella geojedonensis]|uniref:toxin TcdB middle/N-terminal domain-containing protein n=1 Tax=Kangiella geojedonensis TaxID=914150 RepID=UPI0014701E5A|nr:toxin TcdB middle/N-terminal domain-containing protein [Kangiella geojedonensis]